MVTMYRCCVLLFSLLFFSARFAGTGMSCLNPDSDANALKRMQRIDPKASKADLLYRSLYHLVLHDNDHKKAAEILPNQ